MLLRCKPISSSTKSLFKIAHSFWCLEHMWISFAAEQPLPITPMQGIDMFASSPSLEGKQHLWFTSNQWNMAKVTAGQPHDYIALCKTLPCYHNPLCLSLFLSPLAGSEEATCYESYNPRKRNTANNYMGKEGDPSLVEPADENAPPVTMLMVASWRGFG